MARSIDIGLQQALQAFLGIARGDVLHDNEGQQGNGGPSVVLTGSSNGSQAALLRSSGFTSIREFALLPSAKEARWLIPIGSHDCTLTGLDIYRPHASGARFLKRLLLGFTQIGWRGWVRHKVLVASRQPLRIESLVRDITGELHPVFALSLGSGGRFRKLTIQAMRPDGEVLGYMKLPLIPGAVDRVRHEATMLERLSRFAALQSQVPRVLHSGEWEDSYILFQSAGPLRAAPVEFASPYQDFLKKLWSLERVDMPGHALLEEVGSRWRKAEASLDSKWRTLGELALRTANRELEKKTVRCGITHGDFAPWNCRINKGQLYVFDWESGALDAPILWDAFHFHTQVAWSLKRGVGSPLDWVPSPGNRSSFLLYLLSSACNLLEEGVPHNGIGLVYRQRCLAEALSRE